MVSVLAQLVGCVQFLLVLPARPRPGRRLRWVPWAGLALLGIASRRRGDGQTRRWPVWFLRSGQGLVVRCLLLLAAAVLAAVALVRGSLPQLDGTCHVPGLSAPVRVERDGLGVPTVHAASRADLAAGLGFVHAQDRFFQMDLQRRLAAGELAALAGPVALDLDRRHRLHRFRAVARRALARLDGRHRAELEAYVRGVNAGLESLGVRPFEYLALGRAPEPWTAEDSILVMLSMYLLLQQHDVAVESALGVARETLPDELFRLLAAPGDEWDAPLEGAAFATPPLPSAMVFDVRTEPLPFPEPPRGRDRAAIPGSNNWAVDGKHTSHGGALLANDMHLGLGVPNTWYRAALVWKDARGNERRAWGATLPGGPGLVVGSNGRAAWGLTNSEGDWADLVRLEIDPSDPGRYRTPDGSEPFQTFTEVIQVKGGPDVERPVRWTRWGPVLDDTEYHRLQPLALRWVAHDAEALNLRILDLVEADTLEEAVAVAASCAGPQCNFLAADAAGDVGWTLFGRIPRRVGFDGRTPESWADGTRRWDGYLDPAEAPRILRPKSGRLWTANNRAVAGEKLARLGLGGYDRGARAGQIRDRLFAKERLDEADMLAIQLDDRALFLDRWRKLLLDVLSGPWADEDARRGELRRRVARWGGRADRDSAGYGPVLDYHRRVSRAVLTPLTARCRRVDATIHVGLWRSQEGAVWRILRERPAHLLDPRYPSWDGLLRAAADDVLRDEENAGPDPAARTWRRRNVSRIRHPLAAGLRGVPLLGAALGGWLDLDMAAEPLDGGWGDMPRVQMPAFGASERFAVSPGREQLGYFHMPCGQSGHPLSPHYRDGHAAWARGEATPFLPGEAVHVLTLE
jgi:penicillin amidase